MRSVNEFNFAVLKYNYNINSDLHGGHFCGMAQKKHILLISVVSRGVLRLLLRLGGGGP